MGLEGQSLRRNYVEASSSVTPGACGKKGEQAAWAWLSIEARGSLGSQIPSREEATFKSKLLPTLPHVCHLEQSAQTEPSEQKAKNPLGAL